MPDVDSHGQLEMRALSRRLKDYAADLDSEPERAFDLKMAAELLQHLANLTTKPRVRPRCSWALGSPLNSPFV